MKFNEKFNLFKNNRAKKQINYLKQKKLVNEISFLIDFQYKINLPIENKRLTNKENKKILNNIFNTQKIIILNILLKLFIFCLYFSFSECKIRKLEIGNEVSITILGTGNYQTILGSNVPYPNEVIIDGQKMDFPSTNYKLEESEHNIIFKWNSPLTTCNNMFYNIERILTADFSNFDSSQITDLNGIFFGCKYLKSINFKNFGTSLIKSMDDMFFGCNSLISIDLSGFDTSSVTTMRNMFRNCTSLKTLDLSSFKTSSLRRLENMFYDAQSLLSLDLSNFNISLVEAFPNTFYGCKSLVFINLNSLVEKSNMGIENLLSNELTDLIYCIDENKASKLFNEIQKISKNNDCDNICFTKTKKIIPKKKKCIDDCKKDDTYIYEFNNICYDSIQPQNSDNIVINENTEENEKPISEIIKETEICQKDDNIEKTMDTIKIERTQKIMNTIKIERTQKIIDTIKIEITQKIESTENYENIENEKTHKFILKTEKIEDDEIITEKTKNENNEKIEISQKIQESESKNENKITECSETEENQKFLYENFFKESKNMENKNSSKKDEIIKIIKEGLMNGHLNNLLKNLTSGKKQDLITNDQNTIYQITTTENQKKNKYTNISTVNLGDCEKRLKEIYGIDKNLSLLIFKIDYYQTGLLIPVIGYEIYHPKTKSKLDLNYCKDIFVKLNIPVSIDESKVFKHDPNSEYYNDECYSYTTENGTDILLDDRKNEYIDNNLSLCEINCIFKEYNKDTKKAECECETKNKIGLITEIMNNKNILSINFSSDNSTSNIISMKCTKTLFTKEGLITNIGSYFLIFTFLFFAISTITFYKCGVQIIENNIEEIMNLKKKNNKKSSKSVNKINIFNYEKKKLSHKPSIKLKKKKSSKISNPKKRSFSQKLSKKKRPLKIQKTISSSKLELKNTNIFINIGKNKTNKPKTTNIKNHATNLIKKKISFKIQKYNDCELNFFNFKMALISDKRTFCQYYFSLLKNNNLILFAFYPINDYNLKIIKISLFFLAFDIYFFVNSLFFNYSSIHQIYEDGGAYNFYYFISSIICSFFISYYFIIIIKYISLSQIYFLELKYEENWSQAYKKVENIKKCLIIKYFIFYILSFIFICFFWYYLASFCAVFKNTQFYAIENTFISFGISLLYPLFYNFLPCSFRFFALKNKNTFIFKISKLIQLL